MNALKSLLFYSLMMITLPLVAFFATRNIVENYLGVISSSSYIYSTIVSVVVVHIVLGLFVYHAYNEKPGKQEYIESKLD